MTLNTRVSSGYGIEVCRVEDIRSRRVRHVLAAWSVAALTADVPFRNLFRMDVIADGVASIAGRAGRALHVVVGVEGCPPVSTLGHFVGTPRFVGDIPLRGKREVIVTDFGEVALLPETAVDKGNLLFRELRDCVGGQIRSDGLRMLARIAHHICHGRLLPACVDLLMAFLAALRTGVVSGGEYIGLLRSIALVERAKTANKDNELPRVCGRACAGKRRHSRELDAVLDDVVDLAVSELLSCR